MEETAEYQVGVDDTSRRRRLRLKGRKAIVVGTEEQVSVREELKCYCRCMQVMLQASPSSPFSVKPFSFRTQKASIHQLACICIAVQSDIDVCLILQAQLEALMGTYGVQQTSTKAALPIWTAMLAQSGLLSEAQQQ